MPARYRTFFWPAVLILAGVLALLVNIGVLPADRLYLLFDLWPVILIVIGLEIIVRRSMHGANAELAAALIVLLAIAGAAGYVALSSNRSASHAQNWAGTVGSLHKVSVEIDAGAATLTISDGTNMGADLYRAHIEYSGRDPQVELDGSSGTLSISQASGGFLESRQFVLGLVLNPSIPLASMRINTGAGKEDITLGPPSGNVPITIDSGAVTVRLHRPAGSSYSIDVSGGTVSLDADGHHFGAIGDVSYHAGDLSSDAYRIKVSAGACNVTIDTTSASD